MTRTLALRRILLAGLAAAALGFPAPAAAQNEIPPELRERLDTARADFDRARPACDIAAMEDAAARMESVAGEASRLGNAAAALRENGKAILLGELANRARGAAGDARTLIRQCRENPPRTTTPEPAPVTSPGTGAAPVTSPGTGAAPVTSPGTGTAPVPSPSTGEPPVPPEGIGPRLKARFDAAAAEFRAARDRCDIPAMQVARARMQAARDQLVQLIEGLRRADVTNRRAVDPLETQALVMSFALDDARRAIEQCPNPSVPGAGAAAGGPAAPGREPTETERAALLRAALDADRQFRLARDRCDAGGMAAALNALGAIATAAAQRGDENEGAIRTLRDNARSELDTSCPRPPAPALETPVNPSTPGVDDVMQAPRRAGGPTYNVGFGATWLNDHSLDLGLVQGTFDVDFDLDGDPPPSGLGGARLGPRFRLTGELGTGLVDESHELGSFSDSVGLRWTAIGYGGIVLPIGDSDADGGGDVSLYARAGYGFARFSFEASGPGFDFEDASTSDFFAFGAGGEFFFDRRNGVRVGYTRWDDFESDGISANLFGLSYVHRFGGGR